MYIVHSYVENDVLNSDEDCDNVQVNLHTNGLLARRCYYTLVSVLDAIYDRPAVAEHTGEVVMHSHCC